MTLQHALFPSSHFPAADLRVSRDTVYHCCCPSCSSPLSIWFGWLVQSTEPPETLPPQGLPAVRAHFQSATGISNGHFEFIECGNCGAAAVIQTQIGETSNGVYHVVITGAAQVAI